MFAVEDRGVEIALLHGSVELLRGASQAISVYAKAIRQPLYRVGLDLGSLGNRVLVSEQVARLFVEYLERCPLGLGQDLPSVLHVGVVAEVGAFVGLAVLFRESALALTLVVTALGGSLLVSYARARGESVGVVCKQGIMQRAERLLLIGFAGLFDPVATLWAGWDSGTLLIAVLGLVAVGTLLTAVFRTVWIARRLS